MTITNGVASAPTLRVRCTTPGCPAPADTTITLPMVGDRVAGRPELVCTGCDRLVINIPPWKE